MRVLVVRLGAMGDVLHVLPAVSSLRASFPDAEIAWAIEPRWRILLEGNPQVDRVIEVDRRSVAGVRRARRELQEFAAEVAIDAQGLIKSAVVARMSGAERRYGFDRSEAREPWAAMLYTHPVRTGSAHMVDRAQDLMRAMGATVRSDESPLPLGKSEGSLPEGPFVLTSPLAGWGSKQWPVGYYSELASLLRTEWQMPLVVNGSPQAEPELRTVGGAMVHVGSIGGLIDATRKATLVVGVDSGPLHLAAALGKKGVAIYGPTDPERNGPRGGEFRVLREAEALTSYKRHATVAASMAAITPAMVLDALREVSR